MRIVKEDVITTALKLLDEVGIEGLTMRKLADALNIQAPSLYWHFANKDALLEGMADALMQSVATRCPKGEPWDARLRRVASDIRAALLSRRDAARVFAGTYPLSENVLRVGSLLIGCLKEAGADDRVASWGAFTLVYFVIGFVIEEQALGGDKIVSDQDVAQLAAQYPLAAVAMREITAGTSDQRFGFGLDLQLRALRAVINEATAA
ncbi:TetR/AcrR family transcriptional regulator C-terminal domain-containing protein [Agrobacterium pusense]|uniref:TetR/AcrR family transcriptional regulator C-terminal domain-containing protein n=1 Tax=Agrobacterium pusense TaxID=648995 RepID=UPI0028A0F02D|nr:TetR/AcrR family transcriptional regulator C-terminal domain-containing protein [Agrobacterium pusense]